MSTCPVNRDTVKNGIEVTIDKKLSSSGNFTKEGDLYIPVEGTEFANQINNINNAFGENMVMPAFQDTDGFLVAEPSDLLVNKYLNANASYQLTSQLSEQADTALNQRLIDYLKPLGVTVEMVDDMKARVGVDSLGAVDIINKIIAVSKNDAKLDTLPEETAHFFIELLGRQNQTLKDLLSDIQNWSGYDAVKEEYAERYNNDEYKIKKEAAAKLIGSYIVQHKDVEKTLLDKVKEIIQEILALFTVDYIDANYIAQDIAVDILNKNYSQIKGQLQKGARLVDYESTVAKDKVMQQTSDKIRDLGFYLTGSLALRQQGTVYRPGDENLHDLDFKIPKALQGNWEQLIKEAFNITGDLPIEYEFTTANSSVKSITLNGIVVDFFIDHAEDVIPTAQGTVTWQDIFKAKLAIGRQKDLTDFLAFNPNEPSTGFDNSSVYLSAEGSPLTEKQEEDIIYLQRLGLLTKGYTVIDGAQYFYIPTLFNKPNTQAVNALQKAIAERNIEFLTVIDTGSEYLVKVEGVKPVIKGANELDTSQSSKAGEITKGRVLRFLDNVGFRSVQNVSQLVYKGEKLKGNAYTDLANGIMQIVDGMDDYTLPEEAMHVLVALVKESRPELYSRMMKEIINYKMYSTVLNDPAYADDPLYKHADGSINHDKIKEEAVAKLLAEYLINHLEGTTESERRVEEVFNWWRTIKLWIQELFGKYKNPFKETLDELNRKDTSFGEFLDISSQDIFLSAKSVDQIDEQTPENKPIYETITNRPSELDITKIVNDTENAYYKEGVKAPEGSRISDKVAAFNKKLFGNRGFDETQREYWERSRKDGDHIHEIMEEIIKSFIDTKTGIMRKNPGKVDFPLSGNPIQGKMVQDLYDYLKVLMSEYDQGTRFISEQIIYDSTNELYGTIDFAAIKPDGTVDIFDWKSMLMKDLEGTKDYKKQAIFIQLGEYARVLKEEYGVEKLGKIRAIPIEKTYTKEPDPADRRLVGITIGDPDAAQIGIEQRRLRPVISPLESTGSEFKDEIIQKLSALYQDYVDKGYFRDEKAILSHVQEAIYEIRVSNSIDNLATYFVDFKIEVRKLLDSQEELIKSGNQEDIQEALALISFYRSILENIVEPAMLLNDDLSITESSRARLNREIYNIGFQKRKLDEMEKVLLNDRAEKKKVFGLLLPEKVVNLLGKLFRSMGSQNVATIRYMYELVKDSFQKINIASDDDLKVLKNLKFNFDTWQKAQGLDNRDAIAMLVDYEEGKIHSKLDKSFMQAREAALLTRDKDVIKKFIEDNYDLTEYNAWYAAAILELKSVNAKETFDPFDKVNDAKIKNNRVRAFETTYNIYTHPVTAFNYQNKRVWSKNIKEDLWLSPEYKALSQPGNEAVLAMYDHMVQKNKELADINGIDDWQAYTFLPNVMKTFADIVDIDDNSSLAKVSNLAIQQYKNWKASVSVDNYMLNYQGARDPYTGKKIEKRYIPYLSRIDNDFQLKIDAAIKFGIINKGDSTEKLNEQIAAYKAISPANKKAFETEITNKRQMSFDIFAMYGLMSQEINKEKYLLQNDDIIRALVHVEKNKKTFLQNKFGKLDLDANGRPKKSTELGLNAPILEEHYRAIVNGESIQYDADHVIQFRIREKWNKSKLAKLYRFDIHPDTYEPTSISATKFLLWLNSANQKRILGVNLASALSNLFGGTYASNKLYQKYLAKDDLHKAWLKMTSGGFYSTEDMKKNAALVDYFLPLLQNREDFKASQLSINDASKILSQEWLMMPMRKTSEIVQLNIFLALIDNTALINGELVNIRDAVRAELKYDERYNLPEAERKELEKTFDKRIKEMKEQTGLVKMAQFKTVQENGKDKVVIDIPGIDRTSESFYNLRDITQTMAKDALGEADEFDLANYKYSVWWRLFMTFKNWIPRQADVRMGEFRYDQAHHAYEYGRFRMFARALSANYVQTVLKIIPVPYLTGAVTNKVFSKNAIIEKAKAVYQDKLKGEKLLGHYNKDTFITEGEFIDKFVEGSEATFAEIRTLLFMMSLLFLGVAAPDDDDDAEDKAVKTLVRRQLNKLIDEVGFFYSPKSGIDIAGGGAPVFSIIRDGWYLGTNVSQEFFGFGFDAIGFDEKGQQWQESAKPIKRAFKVFPVLKEILTYLPAVDNETAKEWGVTISDRRAQ